MVDRQQMPGGANHYLEVLQRDQATGEFIAASTHLELRIFFQQGRVAWATSNQQPRRAFREVLVRECGVRPDELARLIDEARRRGLNIAGLLVERQVASPPQVRRALRAQVEAALRDLDRIAAPEVRFLPQEAAFATYDAGLTFPLEELLPVHDRWDRRPVQEVYQQVRRAIPGLSWAACVEAGGVAAVTSMQTAADVLGWHAALHGTGATQLVLKHEGTVVVGAALARPGDSLWGGLDEVEGLPRAMEVLASVAPPSGAPVVRTRPPDAPVHAAGQPPVFERALRQLVERDADVEAVATTSRVSTGFVLGHNRPALAAWLPRASARANLFQGIDVGPDADRSRFPVAALEDEFGWWFGTPFGDPMPGTLWVLANPEVTTAMGFALVRSLRRRVLQLHLKG